MRARLSAGNRLSVVTFRIFAKSSSSSSVTQRSWASICDSVPREMSNPASWHRVASSSCVRSRTDRRFLICGPTMLAGVLVLAMRSIIELDHTRWQGS